MLLKVIGDASRINECSILGMVYTDIYLADTDIPNYTRAYFGDNWKASVIKTNNQFNLSQQVVFNAIVFLMSDELPIGYAILDNPIDMVTSGITDITFDLTQMRIDTEYNAQVSLHSICDYSGHISSKVHPRIASLNTGVTSGKYIKSLKSKPSSVTGNLQDALLNKKYAHGDGQGIFHSNTPLQSSSSVVGSSGVDNNYSNGILGGNIMMQADMDLTHITSLYYLTGTIMNGALRLSKYSLGHHVGTAWASNQSDIFLNNSIRMLLFSDYVARYKDNNIYMHSLARVTKDAVMASVVSGTADFSFSVDDVACCRNLITNKLCLYEINTGKFVKSLNTELNDLIDKLNCSITLKQADFIYGYTNTMIIYGSGDNTYIRSMIPINGRITYTYPYKVRLVRAINERSLLLCTEDGTWKLLRLKANEGMTGFTPKFYNLGKNGSWNHLNLLTSHKVSELSTYDPIMSPGEGMIYFATNSHQLVI